MELLAASRLQGTVAGCMSKSSREARDMRETRDVDRRSPHLAWPASLVPPISRVNPAEVLPRIIHEASATSADTRLRRAVSPSTPSTYCWGLALFFLVPVPGGEGQAPPQMAEPVPWPPSVRLASRLHAFATNLHESCGLRVFSVCAPPITNPLIHE